ncbi:MAG: Ig-like domain-containing protein [Gordonia sp. (in: high G+C Gram-positive bacteria)]|uniref:L,D-transpeptidase n=1 Tax=Gordonia sp. (in: high G+C Gram-positive bacteria) TaxID=84139 RepID=UPI003BB6A642
MAFTRLRGRRNSSPRTAFTKTAAISILAAASVALSACSGGYNDQVHASGEFIDMVRPAISVTDGNGKPIAKDAVGVEPGQKVVVTASDGALNGVRIDKVDGTQVKGILSEDGATWTSDEPFGYDRRYTVQVEALGVGGKTTTSQSFTTQAPNNLTQAYIMPSKGETVGIAQTVGVRFDEPIPNRKAAQDAIKITTTPAVEGAFYWISSSEVRWRPQHFWQPNTKVDVEVNTYGINLGDGLFGAENVNSDFTVGRAMTLEADDNTKTVVIKKGDEVIRTMPTSFGKPGHTTPNGIYMIGDRLDHIVMDSSTYGVPIGAAEGYRTPVDWAVQMSYSGIYLHGAPWSMWAQGNTNTSHGCLNLSPDDAMWLVRNTLRGDPVTVRNTGGETLDGTEGLGDWNIPWSVWQKGNATDNR